MTESDLNASILFLWFCGFLLLLIFLRGRSRHRYRLTAIIATAAVILTMPALIVVGATTCTAGGCGDVLIIAVIYMLFVAPLLAGIAWIVSSTRPSVRRPED